VKNKPSTSLVVSLGRHLKECLYLWRFRQLITGDEGGVAQLLVERWANNRKVAKHWYDSRRSSAYLRSCLCPWAVSFRNTLNAILGLSCLSVYPTWWRSLTKDCKQNRSVLE